ncbi:hypothetical protein F511_02015, partial [Dorcoceras hygrometricum]
YVEIGRVALVNDGKEYGELVVIVDVIDQNRICRVPKKKTLLAAMEAADVKGKWEKSSWGRKLIVQKRRACLNDFGRFKLMLAKIKRAGVMRQELAKLKKDAAFLVFTISYRG